MTRPQLVLSFWATVEDCLVEFHKFSTERSAEEVKDLWRRLRKVAPATPGEESVPAFDDIIYHAEPWYIACNLAGQDLPLEPNRISYQSILEKNDLA